MSMNRMERDPVNEKDSDDNQNSQQSLEIKLKKTGQVPQFVRSTESLSVKLNGIIRSGYFKEFQTLSVFYTIVAGPNWERVSGQVSGVSQMSHSPQGHITWNFPIQIIYQTDRLVNPPQIVIVLYGHDFFGRTIPKAYGNIHFPLTSGTTRRKLHTFKVSQYSFWTRLYSLLSGSYYEFKDIEEVLGSADRACLKTESSGIVDLEFQTKRYNFEKYGYES